MIQPTDFLSDLKQHGIEFFTGVPDSLLKHFCACVDELEDAENHVINTNEGGAVAMAMGYHLATGKIPMVYLQNSGLGNTINPILSLADDAVYGIPMLLLIGWRGEPGVKDEPQHITQGKVQNQLLDAMGISYEIIDAKTSKEVCQAKMSGLLTYAKNNSKPVALVVRKNTFESFKTKVKSPLFELKREDFLTYIAQNLEEDAIIVSTTGKTSRELFEIRKKLGHSNEKDFLTVGGMGHASQIALGIAKQKKNRPVYCIDGDGAALMHMGSIPLIGQSKLTNYKHILLNNGAHESVGGQPTMGFNIGFSQLSELSGYNTAWIAESLDEVTRILPEFKSGKGPLFLEVKLSLGSRDDLGRPTKTPMENKRAFMEWVMKP